MYLLTFQVRANTGEYDFNCFSQAITITKSNAVAYTYDPTQAPNYILKYEGDYSAIDPEEIKASVYNYMYGYNVTVAGVSTYSGSVYITFYSPSSSQSLMDTLTAQGLPVSTHLVFVYASINNRVINCTDCIIVVETQATSTQQSASAAAAQVTVAIGAIVGGVVGGLVAVVVALIAFLGIRGYQKTSNQFGVVGWLIC